MILKILKIIDTKMWYLL